MTRNYAIKTLVDYFEKVNDVDDEVKNAIDYLARYLSSNRLWTDKEIRIAIEHFIEQHGRPPRVKELDLIEGLPPHPSISNLYKMPAGKWLLENYPPSFEVNWRYNYTYDVYTREDYIKYFTEEFIKVNPTSAVDFNARRNQNYPSWQFVAKQLGITKWTELKELCGVEYKPPVKTFKVKSTITNLI